MPLPIFSDQAPPDAQELANKDQCPNYDGDEANDQHCSAGDVEGRAHLFVMRCAEPFRETFDGAVDVFKSQDQGDAQQQCAPLPEFAA